MTGKISYLPLVTISLSLERRSSEFIWSMLFSNTIVSLHSFLSGGCSLADVMSEKKNGTLCTHSFWVYLWRMHTGCSKTEGYTYMETKFETKFITLCISYINRSVIDHLCQFRQCDLLSKWQWRPRKGFIIVGEHGARWATFCSNTNIFKINGHTQLKFCICIVCEISSKVSKSTCTHHAIIWPELFLIYYTISRGSYYPDAGVTWAM